MKIQFNRILDSGSKENERLLFSILEPCNLGNYIVALSKRVGEHRVSSTLENIKWLEDAEVKPQDIVVIYTHRHGEGIKTIQNKGGQTSYFLFWNLADTLSSLNEYSVVCFEASWKTIDIGEVVKQNSDSSEGE